MENEFLKLGGETNLNTKIGTAPFTQILETSSLSPRTGKTGMGVHCWVQGLSEPAFIGVGVVGQWEGGWRPPAPAEESASPALTLHPYRASQVGTTPPHCGSGVSAPFVGSGLGPL